MFKTYASYHKSLIKLALPLVMTQAGQTIVQLVDSAMVGRVGTNELAAASFASSVFILLLVFGQGLILGLTPLLGKAFGSGRKKEAASFIKNGYLLYTIVTLILFILTWSISYLTPLMGQKEAVLKLALPYYRILCLSLIPTLFFSIFKQVGEGLGNTVTAMVATIISNLINIFLNWLLIFGNWGFPALGLRGAGYATLLARLLLPFLIYGRLRRLRSYQELRQYLPQNSFSLKRMKEILTTGLPIALQILIEVMMFAFAGIMMGWIGSVPLAAHQVANSLTGLTFMMANGLSQAATIRLSILRGNPQSEQLKRTIMSSVIIVSALMALTGLLFFLLRFQLPRIFTGDSAVIRQTAVLLTVGAFFQFIDGAQCVALGILRGFADVKVPMIAAVISYLFVGIPFGYLCAFTWDLGAVGIWYGYVAGLGTAAVVLFLRIRYRWKSF